MGENGTSENQFSQTDFPLINNASKTNLTKQEKAKDKPSIWSLLFGEKRCKHCSEKKHGCNCRLKKKTKNKATQSDTDMKNRVEINKVIGNTKEPLICENVTNCVPPKERGGLGCHLYFCIDNSKKTNLKLKRIKQKKEDVLIKNDQTTNLYKGDSCYDEGPKVMIVCDSSHETVPEETQSQQMKREKHSDSTDTVIESESSCSEKASPYPAPGHTEALYEVQDIELNFEKQAGGVLRKEIKNKVQFEENPDKTIFTDVSQPYKESDHKEVKLENKTVPSDPQKLETIVQSFSMQPILRFPEYKPPGQKKISFQDADETILKEYEAYKRPSKIRKSVNKNVGMVGNYSSMSLWRRRQTVLDSNITVILKKLNDIEEKIAEIEDKGDNDNIMMGISCDKRPSRVAISFKKQSDMDKTKEQVIASKRLSREKENLNKIIEVKSQNECVIINSPGDIKVVKERNPGNNAKNSVNSSGIGAHTLGSNSRSIKSTGPKPSVERPICKQNCRSLGNDSGNQWRRISEELKISKPDMTSCPVFL